jgi:hypothetical protein
MAVAALLLILAPAPGRAQAPAAGQFAATVPVDATAASVVKAREAARLAGQRRALDAVVARLAGDAAPAKLPQLGDQAVTDLVASFAVANERMSPVRYQADYTFYFRPEAVRRLLSSADIALAAPPPAGSVPPSGKPVVVLPVYAAGGPAVLWEDPNPWRDAWNQQPLPSGPVPLIAPLGDAGDVATIDAERAGAGDAAALAAEARRNGADEALVALAAPQGPAAAPSGLDVTLRDYRTGQPVATHTETLTANPGEGVDALLRRAVAKIAADVENNWGAPPAADNFQPGALTAVLPIADLGDWVHARARLGGVPQIKKLALLALSRQQATLEIDYVGGLDQLKAGLAQISLDLQGSAPVWRLARNAPGPTQ